MHNPYKILGAYKSMGDAEIRAQYKQVAQRLHPDREGGNAELFQALRTSFEKVETAKKRVTLQAELYIQGFRMCANCYGGGALIRRRSLRQDAVVTKQICPQCEGLGLTKE